VVVDLYLQFVATSFDLHRLLADRLRFPTYYGHNWDAFEECITEPDQWRSTRIRIHGWDVMQARLPRDAALMRTTFDRFADEHPECSVEWVA
jgi:ribonuclease inhibitor